MNLITKILKLLDIEPAEASRVFLLLTMGFFIGTFIATLFVGSSVLFLSNYSEETDLPIAFVISGMVGIILTVIFNYFQSRLSFATLALYTFAFMFISLLFVELSLQYFENSTPIYFLAFVLNLPFSYLSLLIFWGTFGRIFDLRQSKRIIGSIDTGQLSAAIIAYFAIPFILKFEAVGTQELLTICLAAIILAAIVFSVISGKHLSKVKAVKIVPVPYKNLFKDRYLFLMSMFVVLSVMAVTFIDFSFLNVATVQFPEEDDLARFLSYFEATIVIFSFLFQTFVTDRIIAMYGLRVSLLITPILVSLMMVIALVIGSALGITPESSTFMFFFIIVSVSKLFAEALKDALDEPAFKLYFLPIDSEQRFDVQTKIEGTVNAFAGVLAGGVLILLGQFQNFTLLTILLSTLPFIISWYLIANRMHGGYRNILRLKLSKNKRTERKLEYAINNILHKQVNSKNPESIIYGLKLMEKLEPAEYEKFVEVDAKQAGNRVQEFLNSKHIKGEEAGFSLPSNLITKKLAQKALKEEISTEVLSLDYDQLSKMVRSLNVEERLRAAKLLKTYIDSKNIFLLAELLRDANYRVRMEAIGTARKVKRPETWNLLIEMLDKPDYSHAAAAALVESGEAVLFTLESAFNKSGQSDMIMIKLVQIMGRIGGELAQKRLWDKIDYPDKRILKYVLLGFRNLKLQATGHEAQMIINLIDEEIGKTIWNMAAELEIPDEPHFKYLKQALKEEIETNFDQIFMLLSLIYEPQSVQLVKENIESDTMEGIAFGMELLDIFVAAELKPKLFPLVDDISVSEKLRQLQLFYPRQSYNMYQTLNFILGKDYNQISRYTKGCALYAMAFINDIKVGNSILAHFFNEDILLKETAAWVVYHRERETFNLVAERLEWRERESLERIVSKNSLNEGLDDGHFLAIEIIMFLKETPLFKNIKGALLSDIADNTEVVYLQSADAIELLGQEQNAIYVVAKGALNLYTEDNFIRTIKQGEVYGELFVADHKEEADKLEAQGECVLFKMKVSNFYGIMAVNHELTQAFIDNVTKNLDK